MTIKKLTTISFAIMTLLSTSVFANEDYDLSCNANISSDIEFMDNQLTVKSNKDEAILFKANGMVEVNGKKISLNTKEQALALQYFKEVEATIPIVVDITVEALEITNIALTEVFTGLLGESSKMPQKLNSRLNEVATAIQAHVYQNPDSLTFNSAYLQKDLGLGDDLETEIEIIKNEIVSSMIGELMVSLGKAMLNGDSDFSQLEKRMNNLGDEIEVKAEAVGKRLEAKSQDLCARIKSIDDTETELRGIDALRNLDTIHFNEA